MTKLITLPENDEMENVMNKETAKAAQAKIAEITQNIATVIRGKSDKILLTVICLLSEGHILIEDVPGVGKTSLVSALAKTIDCGYSRIQFTPDVMPSDITGFSIYNQKTGEFEFRPGTAMSNLVLADEINRASAKTQSALLEIMEERQVTVDSNTYRMQPPFMVLATQNPIDTLGTYQLPEAQIDRFMMQISLGYPEKDSEIEILEQVRQAKAEVGSVITSGDLVQLIDLRHQVFTDRSISDYIVSIVEATRDHTDIRLGCSPRGSIALYEASKAYALSQGRNYVIPDDVQFLAPHVLAHRMILARSARAENRMASDIIAEILSKIAVPTAQ